MQPTTNQPTTAHAFGRSVVRLTMLALVVPVVGFVLYGTAGRDDSYITYWAADRLHETGSIVNINGDRIEQSTSLLHTVVLAFASAVFHVDVPRVGFVLGILCGALTALAAYALGNRLHPRGGVPAALVVGTLGPLVYWSFGGLETSLAALALTLAMLTITRLAETPRPERRRRDMVAAACSIGAVVTVRPEYGIVLAVALTVAAGTITAAPRLGVANRGAAPSGCGARVLLAAAGMTATLTVALVLARLAYFGSPFPRPVGVKQGPNAISDAVRALANPSSSTSYIRTTLVQSGTYVTLAAALGALLQSVRSVRPASITIGATVVVGLVAVALSGGDWMEAGRLVAPWLTLAAVLAGAAVASIPRASMIKVATGVLVAVNLLGNANYARTTSWGSTLWERLDNPASASGVALDGHPWEERWSLIHRRDLYFLAGGTEVVRALIDVAPSRPRVASNQAGMVVYYMKQNLADTDHGFEFVDMAGLTTEQLDPCRGGGGAGPLGQPVSLHRWSQEPRRCGPLPEATFDGGNQTDFKLGKVGYDVVFVSRLPKPHKGRVYFQWIAVRDDLAGAVRSRLEALGWQCPPAKHCLIG